MYSKGIDNGTGKSPDVYTLFNNLKLNIVNIRRSRTYRFGAFDLHRGY